MSDTDSFIDEVTEEVRRDRLFAFMRRYAWVAILIVLALVGGTAWNEWRKSNAQVAAQSYGDKIIAALEAEDPAARVSALDAIEVPELKNRAVLDLLTAAEEQNDNPAAAAERLMALSQMDGIDPIYKQIAILRATAIKDSGMSAEDRRKTLEGLALGKGLIRLLASEQIAYLDIETDDKAAALNRFQTIISDEEATGGLRSRAAQMIVALGGKLTDDATQDVVAE